MVMAACIVALPIAAKEGVITTVVGSSGAGKTTLPKTISGHMRAAAGEVHVLGKRINNANVKVA